MLRAPFDMPNRVVFWVFLFALLVLSNALSAQTPSATRQFAPGSWTNLNQLPASRLRSDLERLPPAAQERSRRWLRSFHFTEHDLPALHADPQGGIFYVCNLAVEGASSSSEPTTGEAAVPVTPFPASLIFHSRPGAANVLYLNFTGETVTNTQWNVTSNRAAFYAVAFSKDADYATFSDAEQVAIKRIWQRVAEDYAPFDIDVTTERPATFNNRTAHALITRSTDSTGAPNPASNAGGVAYVNVFNTASYANYRPGWIYSDNLGPGEESFIAEATSHEIGHNMGLSHDGTSTLGYYGGHGSGDTSWGPLMGTGYNRNVSQWCKGEYFGSNNTQDDLAIISGKAAYRTDDVGGTAATASALVMSNGTNVFATTPETDPANTNTANKGVLERNTDVDVFSFITGSGPVNLAVQPAIVTSALTRGGNLDVRLELYNDAGGLLMTNNSASLTSASIQTNLPQGRYYLHVKNTGTGSPLSSSPSGYTSYGSIGQYFISGFVTASSGFVAPPLAAATVTDVTATGQGGKQFTVTYSDDVAVNAATIDANDIRITGPNGYDHLAQFVSLNLAGNGTPRTATYAAPPPNNFVWLPADNGVYTVMMQSNQVADTEGAYVAPAQLGQFTVAVPQLVYSANMSTNPGWTLQPLWQYGAPNESGGPPSGFTDANVIAYNLSGDYENNLSAKYATTPVINATGSTSLTLQFRRWLGLKNRDDAFIEASTNGTSWVTLWSASSAVNDTSWTLVQYALPAGFAGTSSLRLRWGIASGPSQSDIGWNIDDVEIFAGGAIDTAPPVAALSVGNVTSEGAPSQPCSVIYTDATAVRLATLDSADLLVTGPAGYSNLVEFVAADLPLDGSPITASYAIPAPGGVWDATDNGTYALTLLAGQVEDTLNNTVPQTALGSFSVAIATNAPGLLTVTPSAGLNSTGYVGGAFSPAAAIYSLTNSGGLPLDWIASANMNWLELSITNGTLAPGAGVSVTVSINSNANALSVGDYTASVSFANATTGNGNTFRGVNLTVLPIPTVTLDLSATPPGWGSVAPTNGAYPQGTNLQLIATPAAYYRFNAWTGDVSGTNNPLAIALNSNLIAQALFAEVLTTNFPTPHWWLAANGYTNDFESAVVSIGANGHPLWQSFVAGLDPNDPGSRLLLGVATADGGTNLVLSWNTVTGRVYSVWSSTNLPLGFSPLDGGTNLPWTMQSITNPVNPASPGLFFRLEVQKP